MRSETTSLSSGRTCLLKGCGKRFVPRPQDLLRAKYCSPLCREKAARWRASLRRKNWRQSPRGREAKRRENHRYRKKHPDYQTHYRERNADRLRATERASKRFRRASSSSDVHKGVPCCQLPCHRPGCYVRFLALASLAGVRRYCGPSCRSVMRTFSALLAQLRYRKTAWGKYRRKCSGSSTRSPPEGFTEQEDRL